MPRVDFCLGLPDQPDALISYDVLHTKPQWQRSRQQRHRPSISDDVSNHCRFVRISKQYREDVVNVDTGFETMEIRFTGDNLVCLVDGECVATYQASAGPMRPPTLDGTLEDRRPVKSGDYELCESQPNQLIFYRMHVESQEKKDHFQVVVGRSGSALPTGDNLIVVEESFFKSDSAKLSIDCCPSDSMTP